MAAQQQEPEQASAVRAEAVWHTPDYEIVDASLEVTAYLLARR